MKKKKDITYEDLEPYVRTYIKWEDIEKVMGKRMYKKFIKFMFGQTSAIEGAYPWDVENFFSKNRYFD